MHEPARRFLRLVGSQVAAACRSHVRDARTTLLPLLSPLLFLVVYCGMNPDSAVPTLEGGAVPYARFFTPAMVAFMIVATCYTDFANALLRDRERGVLRRVRMSPVPPATYLLARGLATTALATVGVVVTIAIGALSFDVDLSWKAVPWLVLTCLAGAACCATLAAAVSGVVRRSESGALVTYLTAYPILLISGVFSPLVQTPPSLIGIARLFPVWHLSVALQDAFHPAVVGGGVMRWSAIAVLAAWTLAAAAFASMTFRWSRPPARPVRRRSFAVALPLVSSRRTAGPTPTRVHDRPHASRAQTGRSRPRRPAARHHTAPHPRAHCRSVR